MNASTIPSESVLSKITDSELPAERIYSVPGVGGSKNNLIYDTNTLLINANNINYFINKAYLDWKKLSHPGQNSIYNSADDKFRGVEELITPFWLLFMNNTLKSLILRATFDLRK